MIEQPRFFGVGCQAIEGELTTIAQREFWDGMTEGEKRCFTEMLYARPSPRICCSGGQGRRERCRLL